MATLVNTLHIDRLNESYGSYALAGSPGEIYGFVSFNGVGNACRTGRVGRRFR